MIVYRIYQKVSIINGRSEWVQLDTCTHEETARNYVQRERLLNPDATIMAIKVEETEMDY